MMIPKYMQAMWALSDITDIMAWVESPGHEEDLEKLQNFLVDLRESHQECRHPNDIDPEGSPCV